MTKVMQKELKKTIAPFEKSNLKNSTTQILNTIIPFFLLWYLAYESLALSYLMTLPIIGLAAGFLVRIFIIFHDCCHQSFFKNKKANEMVGTFTGILTLFPYHQWRHCHNIHHATSSNLNKRGTGDIWVMTVQEYSEASFWQRMIYRLYRNPLVMFGLGPFYLFLISNRFNRKDARIKERINTYFTTFSAVILYSFMSWLIGWQAFLLVQGPILFISGALGIWLFYVQHHFEDSYFESEENWDFVKAAVEGSSFYKLPKILQWLTGNIGYHHVHHLSPRVPNYYLEEVHDQNIPLNSVPTVTIRSSLNAIRYRLWDEGSKQFVSFREIKRRTVKQKFSHKIVD
ncbi:fatty acid desaturase [Niallia endozanthoxylica]|uniref:Fatty acid desaturase n=1 Tax=Niallia endozanthoxylica TaxID=2036016 RepID=A0A5J5HNK5_9BACI|nr:fatty acid desaturase [Niallia endozanthoxylica]KAA9021822.1 fatty acid desaturase [Niallia endozanthoxylica]